MLFSEIIERLRLGDSELIDFNVLTNPDIINAESLEKAIKNQITFLENNSYLSNQIWQSNASSIIIPEKFEIKKLLNDRSIAWASCKYPKVAFAEILELLYPSSSYPPGIHRTSVIEDNVNIGKDVFIGANVVIGPNSNIGSECIIHPGVVIYDKVDIGERTELHANCVIHKKSVIGSNCIVHSNVVIGSEGFGFIPTNNGWKKMPQKGRVVISDNVEIGACSTVDRPSVGETLISEGTKLDNLVQIGHGVNIGQHCAMAAQVGIAGGAIIEDGVILAGQVGVGNRVKVGKGVIASSKCGVHTDIEPGKVISGFPAMPNKLWLRCSATFKKLPDLAKTIRQLSDMKKD